MSYSKIIFFTTVIFLNKDRGIIKLKSLFIVAIAIFFVFGGAEKSLAGFGVSPPAIWNDYLVPGAHYEQIVYLVRGNPDENIEARVTIEAPEIENWIKIEQGNSFILPQNEKQFPMKVIIDVPKDAGYGLYEGIIRIRTVPVNMQNDAQITVAQGSKISLKLRITDKEFIDFKLQGLLIPPLEEDWPIKVEIKMENLGNIKIRPTRVRLSIFNKSDPELISPLGSFEATQMTFVEPFSVGKSIAEFTHNLKPDEYWGEVIVFKEGKEYIKDKIYFKVASKWSIIPKPLTMRTTEFITASTLRVVIVSVLGTLLAIGFILGGMWLWKKRKKGSL